MTNAGATRNRGLVALASENEPFKEQVAGAASRDGFQVLQARTPGAIRTASDRLTAVVAVAGELDPEDERILARMGRRSTVLAAVHPGSILDAGDLTTPVDAWLFLTDTTVAFSEIVALARSGYTSIPEAVADLSEMDKQRRAILATLSDPERDLLRAAAFGRTNREIADQLGVSEDYATYLLRRLLKRLRFHNRTEAAVFAARNGLLSSQHDDPLAPACTDGSGG